MYSKTNPFTGAIGQNFQQKHNNSRPHKARIETNIGRIEVFSWSAKSPDLNPIE